MTRRLPSIIFVLTLSLLLGAPPASAGEPRPNVPTQRWQAGKGNPQFTIVYMHGWGGAPRSGMIRRLGGKLARGRSFEVIEPNGWGAKAHTMSSQLAAAKEAIRGVPKDRPVFVIGHSLGGKGAIWLSQDKEVGQRIAGYVALAPSVKMLHGAYKRAFGKQAMNKGGLPAAAKVTATLDQLAQGAVPQAKQAMARAGLPLGFMRDLAPYDERARETNVAKPGLVFHGKRDGAVSVHSARRFAQENPNARYVEYRFADHGLSGIFNWRTGKMAREIGRFIDQQLAAGNAK